MSNGLLGKGELELNFNSVYLVPPLSCAVITISICNKSNSTALVYLGIIDEVNGAESSTNTPGPSEYLEYSLSLDSYTAMERTGIMLRANQKIVAKSDSSNSVSVMVWGYEEIT